jgi:BirA family biotin operon repressor/biotin-[acetyl-CoA-carboxylase] ligase
VGQNNPFSVIRFDSISSTNDFLKDNYLKFKDFTVVTSEVQKNGYGRRGRVWFSGRGGLWFSFIVSAENPFFWIVCTSVSIVDIFNKTKIKWPNDIYFENLKVAGILSEKINDKIIVGVGLNVNNKINNDLKDKAVSLSRIYNKQFDLKIVLNDILSKIYENYTNPEDIFERWRKYSLILGKRLTIKVADKIYEGKVVDLLDSGELILSDSNHNKKIYYGDIIKWEAL